jgi:hypothetical protein
MKNVNEVVSKLNGTIPQTYSSNRPPERSSIFGSYDTSH